MYSGDSFFTMGLLQGAGLLLVTAALVLLTWRLGRRVCRGGLLRRLVLGLAVFWAFLWVSPQVYYLYYMAILPDLPLQWVIGWPPAPERVGRLLIFRGPATVAAHAQGALGWLLLVGAAWRFRRLPGV